MYQTMSDFKVFILLFAVWIHLVCGGLLISSAIDMGIEGTKHVRMAQVTSQVAQTDSRR